MNIKFMQLPKTPLSVAFEHFWIKLYSFLLSALELPIGCIETVPTFFYRIVKLHFSRGEERSRYVP